MKRIPMIFVLLCALFVMVACTSDATGEKEIVLPDDIPEFVQESDFKQIDWEKKAVEFGERGIIGNENKSGVIGADMPSLNVQKWMWHLWGIKNPGNKKLTIVGFHKETEKVHQILKDSWTTGLAGPNNGADAHTPSSVKIPESGEWAILLYTDDTLFDTLIYQINE
ncbi:hypothetical protein GCM10011409_18400 [Lentibacillus populi]|uniref:DUF4871 domain-containing protein n=1 Tax=Lentibacillus populi TaxID=1827502 RepID=A0A9W5TX74_9BACI|nr:hypothetical protein [Lentibacillus populi]GGB41185.1 hypothetical protein GCM10011409_18400 [Lentibacillus populi]